MDGQAEQGGKEPETRAEGRAFARMRGESGRSGERDKASETKIRIGRWFQHERSGHRQDNWWNRRIVVAGVSLVAVATLAAALFVVRARKSDDNNPLVVAEATTTTDRARATTTEDDTTTSTRPTTTSTSTTTTTIGDGSIPPRPGEIRFLADLVAVDHSYYDYQDGQANLSGEIYTRSLMIDPYREDVGFIEYDVGRNYSTLQGFVGVRDDVPSETVIQVQIYSDGTEILNSTVKLGDRVAIDLGIENALRLRLQVTELTGTYRDGVYVVFADLKAVAG